MATAQMTIEILADGQIKVTTANLQGEHHVSADELLHLIHQLAGGQRETKSTRGGLHHHQHHHGHGEEHHHH